MLLSADMKYDIHLQKNSHHYINFGRTNLKPLVNNQNRLCLDIQLEVNTEEEGVVQCST